MPTIDLPWGSVDRINALVAERDELAAQLPEGMKQCTILVKECEKGHRWLTATNWVQHPCPTCERDQFAAKLAEAERGKASYKDYCDARESELEEVNESLTAANAEIAAIRAENASSRADRRTSATRSLRSGSEFDAW